MILPKHSGMLSFPGKPRASGDDPWYAKATYEEVK